MNRNLPWSSSRAQKYTSGHSNIVLTFIVGIRNRSIGDFCNKKILRQAFFLRRNFYLKNYGENLINHAIILVAGLMEKKSSSLIVCKYCIVQSYAIIIEQFWGDGVLQSFSMVYRDEDSI